MERLKTIARMALKPGMVLGENVLNYKNELIFPVDTVVDDLVIAKLARHSIMCVAIKEEIDYATTHFEKVRLSTEFKYFEVTYNDCMPIYRKIMNDFVTQKAPVSVNRLMEQLLDFLYNMLPSEDGMTHAHCLNSALIAGVFGTWLGLPKENIFLLIQCAFFYDIGKLKLPQDLIWKPSKLTDLEFTKMKTHTMLGFDLLKDMKVNDHVLKATLQHHERCDGSGYPSRLRGDKIDVFAKYIAIIDSYEAMTSARTYRQSLNPFQVIANFEKAGFDKYDETIIRPILSHIASTQIGFSVRLSDDTEAEISSITEEHLSRPLLKTKKGETIDLNNLPELEIVAIY